MQPLQSFAARFGPLFIAELEARAAAIREISDNAGVSETYECVLELARAGGKRIRPYVASLAFRAQGSTSDEPILPVLIGIETFHLFALVHDDIMDDANTRHGVPTVHHAISSRAAGDRVGDAGRVGQAHAILAGDALLTIAHDEFLRQAEGSLSAAHVRRAHQLFTVMSMEVAVGQHVDMHLTTQRHCTARDVVARHHLKTSLYTFVRPMQIGAALAGADESMHQFCAAFGSAIGRGFQLEDDLLDILGGDGFGKARGADITQRQHTLLTVHLNEHGTDEQKEVLQRLWGNPIDAAGLADLQHALQDCGAIDHVRGEAEAAFAEAERTLKDGPLPDAEREELGLLLAFLRNRLP